VRKIKLEGMMHRSGTLLRIPGDNHIVEVEWHTKDQADQASNCYKKGGGPCFVFIGHGRALSA
jgi:hypothetical protein